MPESDPVRPRAGKFSRRLTNVGRLAEAAEAAVRRARAGGYGAVRRVETFRFEDHGFGAQQV